MTGRTGAARIALAHGAPVIPVAQWGAQDVIGPYKAEFRALPRKTMHVWAGPAVDLDDLRDRPVDTAVLVEAMRRYPVDSVLCEMNPADPRRMPFLSTVVPEAKKRGVGIIGMKIMGHGRMLEDRAATAHELIRYAASFADTSIVGCSSIDEVRQNLHAARTLGAPMNADERTSLEARVAPTASRYDYFKA